ncbi:MAG TPA: hypothetical protein VJO32_09615, partial [Ktedonobacteraceae bacterium]|nr:hypothetical protein [Ktedonobacteraceae bacterium]
FACDSCMSAWLLLLARSRRATHAPSSSVLPVLFCSVRSSALGKIEVIILYSVVNVLPLLDARV